MAFKRMVAPIAVDLPLYWPIQSALGVIGNLIASWEMNDTQMIGGSGNIW